MPSIDSVELLESELKKKSKLSEFVLF